MDKVYVGLDLGSSISNQQPRRLEYRLKAGV